MSNLVVLLAVGLLAMFALWSGLVISGHADPGLIGAIQEALKMGGAVFLAMINPTEASKNLTNPFR